MSGAGFILAINLFVAGLFALAFFLVAANNRQDRVALWFALAYVFGVLYFCFEFLLPLQENPRLAYVGGFASFLFALTAVTIGIARRYRQTLSVPIVALAIVWSIGFGWLSFDMPRADFWRMMLYQAPYAFMQGLCAAIVLRSGRRKPMDIGLLALFVLSALQFVSKPFVAQLTGGPGATAQDYVVTTYALYSQTLGAVLSVATGLLMLMLLVRDMLSAVTARSETDPLTNVYNRRGFEDRAEPGLIAAARGGVSATLIAADLDQFKAVNDTHGHDAGDRVIAAFAALLNRAAPGRATVARLGGEEFAVFLPGTNIAAARLFAEGVRSSFAALPIDGLPPDARFTASFGVAEVVANESLSELRRRADQALYAAKRSGRDRVCTAGPQAQDAMPSHPFPMAEPPGRRGIAAVRGSRAAPRNGGSGAPTA